MKVSLQQVTIPVNATINITDGNINSDWKGAICFGGAPTAAGTTTASSAFYIGACDSGGRQMCVSQTMQDNVAGATCAGAMTAAACAQNITSSAGFGTAMAYNATLSNGVQLLSSGGAGSRLCNVLMFAGSDIQFGVGSAHIAAATASATITHNLTVVPDLVIVLATMAPAALGTGSQTNGFSVGFYDGVNSVGSGFAAISSANPTNIGGRCGSSSLGEQINTSMVNSGAWSISAVGTSTLTMTRGDTGIAGNVGIIAIGHNSGFNVGPSAYVDTTPTVTGNNTPSVGTTVPPQVWLSLPTRLTSTTFANTDNAGSFGLSAAVNNNGTTQQCTAAASMEHNIATSVAKSYIQSTQACLTLTDTGTVAFNSTLNSWNTTSFTENVGTTTGTAGERINLLYGTQAAPATPGIILYERRYVHFYST